MNLKAADRQRQILRAAAECFARKGFHQTTMDDIAREAGISAGLIYRHFAGKEDLIIALVKAYEDDQRARLDRARQQTDFTKAIEVFFAIESDDNDSQIEAILFVEVSAEALRNPRIADVVQRDDAQTVRDLAQLIVQAQHKGQADPSLAPIETAELLIALDQGSIMRFSLASEYEDLDYPTLKKTFKTLYTRFLRLKPTTGEET
ncbi:MAG: TetR/AcrR family transcriptional regulator [Chloroflexota bacterium]